MTAGYTEAELATLQQTMLESQPAYPSRRDIAAAPQITGVAMEARYNGLSLKILFQSNETLLFKLNCVVASELMASINDAYHGWKADGIIQLLDAEITMSPTEQSFDIVSFATSADANGLPVNFTDGFQSFMVFLPPPIALRILASINSAGVAMGWWDNALVLQPARALEDVEIQQEAVHLINRYGEEAVPEATRRADRALGVGDKFNHDLWQRVTVAVQEIERASPADGNPLTNCIIPRI